MDLGFLTYHKRSVLRIERYHKLEVSGVFPEVIIHGDLWRQRLRANQGLKHLKVAALVSIFHSDVEVLIVAAAVDGGQN